jgi:hypothetical protein
VLSALGGAAGGAGGLMTGLKAPCWVAAEVYNGWLDPRVDMVRRWIFGEFRKTFFGRVVSNVYLNCGELVASAIRRCPVLRHPFKALFDCALRRSLVSR